VIQVVEHLPSKCKALSPNPRTAKQTIPNQNKTTFFFFAGLEGEGNVKSRTPALGRPEKRNTKIRLKVLLLLLSK
jgi:hypothetical protein